MFRHALLAGSAFAALQTPAKAEAPQSGDHHGVGSREIIITAPYDRSRNAVLTGTSVLGGPALVRDLRPTIGETLARLPGVSATSFGPNASRPVLRGLQGDRVRVLKDGIGTIDASSTSVDHAVVVNPLTAERIEVLRGPAALLFGSSAIGGVVNVIDTRIPRSIPGEALHVDALGTFGTAADERSASGRIDVPLAERFVIHLDGSYTKTSDLRTGGFILTPALRAEAAASPEADIRALAGRRGRLPNSAAETWDVAGGAAFIGDGGSIGASFSRYDSLYGLPVRYALDADTEAEAVRLQVNQDRADLRAEVTPRGALIDAIRLRAGFADYRHAEIEETGEIATTFLNRSIEARLEVAQASRGGWKGAFGTQLFTRDFNVIGEEKFVPKNSTRQYGFFTLQELERGAFRGELGLRYEHSAIDAEADADLGTPAASRRFDAVSGSLGGSVALADNIRLGLVGSYTERAPSAEELFANGPHKGTQAFEIGDSGLAKERATNLELSLRGARDGFSFGLSGYHSWFDGFIYETPTGVVEDDLPVFRFLQSDARIWGVEGEVSARVAQMGGVAVVIDATGDYTRANVSGAGPLPRIPPLRLLGGIGGESSILDVRAEVEWTAPQRRVAAFETETEGFTLVNASLVLHPFGRARATSLTLSANNIFDVEARRHASFLKDYAPLAGRDIRVTARFAL